MPRRLLTFVAVGCAAVILSHCKAEPPPKWVVEYFPPSGSTQPPTGTSTPPPGFGEPCHAFVLRPADMEGLERIVAVMKAWNGRQPARNTQVSVGEDFSGPIALGTTTIHDDSTGYDLDIEATYITESDSAAKDRANTNCGIPAGLRPLY
jgi:hypothetical protein